MDDGRDQWSTGIVLSDGDAAFIRPMTSADAPLLLAFHERQPRENLYRRFFSPKPTLTPKELDHFTNIDFHDRVALVMEHRGEFIAWASYERWKDRNDAEVAFMVDEDQQGRGIATLLLEHLAAIARSNGIERFTAETLSDNRAMLRVFSRAGWPIERHFDSGLTEVEFPLIDTEQFVDSVELREHRADSRAIARLLLPKSVAVVGASDTPGTIGDELWRNVSRGFDGPVFAVNPNHDDVGGTPAYRTLTDIVDDVTLAVLAVPVASLPAAIDDCIAKRVRGAVVVTATDGADLDITALVSHARRSGLRLIGPASMGVASPRRAGGVQAALVPVTLPFGGVAISMQSGTLGSSLLQLALQLSLGISWFVSLGDKCDVSGNDLLQFWEDDESTRVIAMYTESFGNPRKFARIARRVGRKKPIVAVRTGTAAIGAAADALYQQAGLIEVPTVRAMLDAVRVMNTQPIPGGNRVAVLTNARSPGVLANAALAAAGLQPVEPSISLDWRSTGDDFATAITGALTDDDVDAVMVIHAPPLVTAPAPLSEIDTAAAGSSKPVVAIMLGRGDGPLRAGSTIPAFAFPEPAAAVLGRMYAYSRWLATEANSPVERIDSADRVTAHLTLAAAIDDGDEQLSFAATADLVAAYGLRVPGGEHLVDASDHAVVDAATRLGYPVVVKATTRPVGRSARAGIALDLSDEHAVAEALAVIRASIGPLADSLVVQRMVAPGVDARIHCTTDAMLGPVVTVGLGSLQTEFAGSGPSRLAPLSRVAAQALVDSSPIGGALRAAELGSDEIVDVIVRVGQLMFENTEIDEIELDPVIVGPDGCYLTDAVVRLQHRDVANLPLRRLG